MRIAYPLYTIMTQVGSEWSGVINLFVDGHVKVTERWDTFSQIVFISLIESIYVYQKAVHLKHILTLIL